MAATSYKPTLLLVWVFLIPLALAGIGFAWIILEEHQPSAGVLALMFALWVNGQVALSVFFRKGST